MPEPIPPPPHGNPFPALFSRPRADGTPRPERTFNPKDSICRKGDHADVMYLIKSGRVEFFAEDAHGGRIIQRILGPGDFFGEIALLTNNTRSTNADAKTAVVLLEMDAREFNDIILKHPEIARALLEEMAHRFRTADERMRHMIAPNVAREIDGSRTPLERFVDSLVGAVGSVPFLAGSILLCIGWVWLNYKFDWKWDKQELPYLAVFLSFAAFLVAILVLAKQNRDQTDENRRAELVLRNTGSAENELQELRATIDKVATELGRLRPPQP